MSPGLVVILVSVDVIEVPKEPTCSKPPYICISIVRPSLANFFNAVTESLSSQLTLTSVLPIFKDKVDSLSEIKQVNKKR